MAGDGPWNDPRDSTGSFFIGYPGAELPVTGSVGWVCLLCDPHRPERNPYSDKVDRVILGKSRYSYALGGRGAVTFRMAPGFNLRPETALWS